MEDETIIDAWGTKVPKIDKADIQPLSEYSPENINVLFIESIKNTLKMYVIETKTNYFYNLSMNEIQQIFSAHKMVSPGGWCQAHVYLRGDIFNLQNISVLDIWVNKKAADKICQANMKKSEQIKTDKTPSKDTQLLTQIAALLDKEHNNFCPELEAAIRTGLYIYSLTPENFKHTGATTRVKNYLRKHYKALITKEDGTENEKLLDRIAQICTPQQRKSR